MHSLWAALCRSYAENLSTKEVKFVWLHAPLSNVHRDQQGPASDVIPFLLDTSIFFARLTVVVVLSSNCDGLVWFFIYQGSIKLIVAIRITTNQITFK